MNLDVERHIKSGAQCHKGLLNIEDNVLFNLDLQPLQKCPTELILVTYLVPKIAGLLVRGTY